MNRGSRGTCATKNLNGSILKKSWLSFWWILNYSFFILKGSSNVIEILWCVEKDGWEPLPVKGLKIDCKKLGNCFDDDFQF